MTKEEVKSSMSPEERARRRAAVGKAATEKVAKSEQLNFRLEEQSISELQAMAFRKGMAVGTMIREWVLERLSQEKFGSQERAATAVYVLQEIHAKLSDLFAPSLESQNSEKPIGLASAIPTGTPVVLALATADPNGLAQSVLMSDPRGFTPSMPTAMLDSTLTPIAHQSSGPGSLRSILLGAAQVHASDLEHLRAWEHTLADGLTFIRTQREQVEHDASK